MGLFWNYFKRQLRWPLIQRPGPLALLAEGGAESLDAARETVLTLRAQFFADRCEAGFLANFARSRGIARAPLETEEHFTARVRNAYRYWARLGRPSTLQRALLDYFGFNSVEVLNRRDEDPALWAEFWVVIRNYGDSSIYDIAQLFWDINEIKPARSKLAGVLLDYEVVAPTAVYIAAAAYDRSIDILYPYSPGAIIAPMGLEVLVSGAVYRIQWLAAEGIASWKIYYSVDGLATKIPIATIAPGSPLYHDWTVPDLGGAVKGVLAAIEGLDAEDNVIVSGSSPAGFIIRN